MKTYRGYLEKYKLGKLPFEGRPKEYTKKIKQVSESCGDGLTFYFLIENETIKNIGFDGYGCFLSRLSASFLAKKFVGKPIKNLIEFDEEKTLALLGFPVNSAREQCVLIPLKVFRSFDVHL
ncbi:MAG: iron-sulfur cluster assembly scaffold protein [Parcubacteria group bacterium]|nr:iron-sulfur cluster assembly scaffold protein [Parcubacteria group bacterium]